MTKPAIDLARRGADETVLTVSMPIAARVGDTIHIENRGYQITRVMTPTQYVLKLGRRRKRTRKTHWVCTRYVGGEWVITRRASKGWRRHIRREKMRSKR